MKAKSVVALALSCVMSLSIVSFVSFGNLLADDTKTLKINGQDTVFYLKTDGEDAGWYTNGDYKILSQDKIVDGKLPEAGRYVLDEDISISDGVDIIGELEINFLGKTITYTNTDKSEYMINSDGNFVHLCSTVESDPLYNVHGTFKSTKGAPFLSAKNYSCNVLNLDINGGKNASYSADENGKSLISFYGNHSLSIVDCYIYNGSADKGGAIILGEKSQCYISKTTISYCSANEGGAIYGEGRNISIENSMISYNWSKKNGGAITIVKDGAVYLAGSAMIRNNTCDAGYGGGIYVDKTGYTDWYSSVVVNGDDPMVMYNKGRGGDSNIYFASNEAYSYVDIESGCGDGAVFKIGISFFEFYNKVPVQGFGAKNVNEDSIVSDNPTLIATRDANGGIYFIPKLQADYFDVTGVNLCLDGNFIGVTFHVPVVSGYDGADLNGYYNAERYSSTPVKADKVEEKNGEWLFTCYMESMEMNTPITFSVGASYNTSLILLENFTISSYAKAVYVGNYSDAQKNIAASMVTYGAASQKYFGFMANSPADYFLSADDKAIMSQDVTSSSSIYYNFFKGLKPEAMPSTENVHYYGSSIIFGSKPTLKMYFTYDEGVNTDLIHWGPWSMETPTFIPGTRYFYFTLEDLNMAYDFDLIIYIPVYYGDKSYDFSMAPASYLYNALMSDKATPEIKELARSMLIYNYYVFYNN
ncbi:MAG: hypothetical protein J6U23_03600 [Clostridiales bacterium]|nr:hypothetical protein [Clostridiales bacterium]